MREIDKEILKRIGIRLKNLRLSAGFRNQDVFAHACGIPRAQYARYEKGSNITILTLQKILFYYKLTWSAFFNEEMD